MHRHVPFPQVVARLGRQIEGLKSRGN